MRGIILFLLTGAMVFGAEDAWDKVCALKGGTEIRIFKKGSVQPLLGKIGEATGEHLVVILKTEEVAIPREQIDRLDYRPAQPGGRMTQETKTTVTSTATEGPVPPAQASANPTTTTTTALVIRPKPDFETIYRRPPPAQKK